MSSYAVGNASIAARGAHPGLYDESRQGSGLQQIGVGIVAIALALVLVLGQVALATTHDIAARLHHSVGNLQQGNVIMQQVIARAAPNAQIAAGLKVQQHTLIHTGETMVALNASMAQILGVNSELGQTVDSMRQSSAKLAGGVKGMARDASSIAGLLGPLPGTAGGVRASMTQIDMDSKATNSQLNAIVKKMQGYGLPGAQGAPS